MVKIWIIKIILKRESVFRYNDFIKSKKKLIWIRKKLNKRKKIIWVRKK